MRLQFLGGAGVVTGSKALVTQGATRLLVDCGLFQGFKELRLRNREPPGTGRVDAIVLTHAHLDHSGYVPAMVAAGYDGPVYCSAGTASLLEVLWPDAGRLQEEEAEHHNRHGTSRHPVAEPLYTEDDALRALRRLVPVPWGDERTIGEMRFELVRAGHILGASSVLLTGGGRRVLFSGDLGRPDDGVVPAPVPPPAVDALVMESTYGDRDHPRVDRDQRLAEVIGRTVDRGGMVLVPTFAVGRAQSLLWSLHCLKEQGRIPDVPIVLDSPMASRATTAFLAHPEALRLSPDQLTAMTRYVTFTESADDSKALNRRTEPFVLLSASGMLTGGRVLHHLVQRVGNEKNTVLFVGFQAPGTRGSHLLSNPDTVRVFGREHEVRCEIEQIPGYSAHADRRELHAWLDSATARPALVVLNHGEPAASDRLRQQLERDGYRVAVASERIAWQVDHLPAAQFVRLHP
jgi:metallo-beta-lactamase family protein